MLGSTFSILSYTFEKQKLFYLKSSTNFFIKWQKSIGSAKERDGLCFAENKRKNSELFTIMIELSTTNMFQIMRQVSLIASSFCVFVHLIDVCVALSHLSL